MNQCAQCSQPLPSPSARFCQVCGALVSQPQTLDQPAASTLAAISGASRYVRPSFDIQLRDAPRGQKLRYYVAHTQAYAVMEAQGAWYALRLGGGQIGWVERKHCADVANATGELALPIPSVLFYDGSHYVWATFEPMPLAQISYDSSDYRLMYQWVGELAARPPTMVGYVRSCQQIGTRTIGQANSYRQSDTEATTVSYSATIHAYQMLVEDSRSARRTVTFEQPPVSFLPQVGDYLVIWGTVNQNGICDLAQGIRRDLHDPSSGSVFVRLATASLKGPPTNWLRVFAIIVLLIACFAAFQGFIAWRSSTSSGMDLGIAAPSRLASDEPSADSPGAGSADAPPDSSAQLGVSEVIQGGNLRSEPRIADETVIGLIWIGDRVTLLEQGEIDGQRWYHVRVDSLATGHSGSSVAQGTIGWASAKLLAEPTPTP